jgi:hypothetical protein
MTLNDRLDAILAANPALDYCECIRRAVNAHRAAQAQELAMQHHPDAFALIDAHLAQRERLQSPQLPLLAGQECRGTHSHD